MLPMFVARSSSDGNPMRYVLLVLLVTKCFHIICGVRRGLLLRDVSQREAMQKEAALQHLQLSALPPDD